MLVPLIGCLFWASVYGTPAGLGWEEERTVPAMSKRIFARGHEGWTIEAEAVTLPPLPTSQPPSSENKARTEPNASNGSNGSIRKRPANGSTKSFAEKAEKEISLSTKVASTLAPEPTPYNVEKEDIPRDVLRGQVTGDRFGVHPTSIPAFWLWKSVASSLQHHRVTSVKPGNDVAGIGSGPALSTQERMVLFFVGGGYHSGHAAQGPLSWTVCRQTSLRVLGVNFRKATQDDRAFPAALQDALASWVYVTKRLGFRPENVILMGDSAGGGLAFSLQMYLSALMWSGESRLGRARKLVLHSPMTDLSLSSQSFVANDGTDVISAYMCSLARDNYLRHVIAVQGRENKLVDPQNQGEKMVDVVAGRYHIDPYTLTPDIEASAEFKQELRRLAKQLPETILELGAFHPLYSPGLDAKQNRYLAQSLLLLNPPPNATDAEVEVLVTIGTGEIFVDQPRNFTNNLKGFSHPSADAPVLDKVNKQADQVKVCTVECIDWHHVFAFLNVRGKVKAQIDEVSKTFMLA